MTENNINSKEERYTREDKLVDRQEQFINIMKTIRKQNKIKQTDLELSQKVISNIENHVVDPKLSTVIDYLDSIGFNIVDLFKGIEIVKRPTIPMVEHLNMKLASEGSRLRYRLKRDDAFLDYELTYDDKYIDNDPSWGCNVIVTKEFEEMVRDFFKQYGIEQTGYSNTVKNLKVRNPKYDGQSWNLL